jgi:hypothetical protein
MRARGQAPAAPQQPPAGTRRPTAAQPGKTERAKAGSTRRRRAATAGAMGWLLALGLVAVVIGGHDAVAGADITVRLWGTLVLGAGAVLIAGSIGLKGGRASGRSLGTLAALLGVVLGVITFLAQVVNDEPDGRLVIWGSIIVVSAGTAALIWRFAPPSEREQGVWAQLPVLKSVVSAGVLFSLAQFWYSSIYLPTTAPASLTVETVIERIAPRANSAPVRGSVVVRNTSGTRVNVLASLLRVSGEAVGRQRLSETEFARQMRDAYQDPMRIGAATRYAYTGDAEALSIGRLVPDTTYLEPDETLTLPFVAWAPLQRFGIVNVDVLIAVARGRALALETSPPEAPSGEDGVTLTRVPEAGWLRALTRGDRFVRSEYPVDVDDPRLDVQFLSDVAGEPDAGFDRRMKRFYGYALVSANALQPVPRPERPGDGG